MGFELYCHSVVHVRGFGLYGFLVRIYLTAGCIPLKQNQYEGNVRVPCIVVLIAGMSNDLEDACSILAA